jgi:hypothetical protein
MKKSKGRKERCISFFLFITFRPSGEEAEVCASTCVTYSDSETGNSNIDIIFQKADDEISSPPEYNESFNISDAPT